MKELSIEEKARAYDRAFKEAKAIHNFSSNIAEIKRMEQIFPELAESEDEKVRKALIKYFSEGREYLSLIPYNKEQCVAWLEKQGEQKPFDYENANAPKSQRIVAAEAKEALYDKPEKQSKELSLGKTIIEINSVRHRLVLDTTDAEQTCKECSLRALCDSISDESLENPMTSLCVPFTRIGEHAHFIMEK